MIFRQNSFTPFKKSSAQYPKTPNFFYFFFEYF